MAASPIPVCRPSVAPAVGGGERLPLAGLPDLSASLGSWPEVDLSGVVLEGRYRLIRPLGVGGMGTVYLAQHALLGTQYAIKVLGPRFAFDREWVQRFFLEARAALMIPHENIVRIHDFAYPEPGRVYMVMELVDGESLADLVEREGALPWQRALLYADQIAAALEAAHARGIVHRDIKPSNCLRCGDSDVVKVLDFGIAKFLDPGRAGLAVPRTSTDVWMGTAEYMAPELFRGERADERVDVYALGALIFKLLTGRTPYVGAHIEVATQMLTDGPPAVSAVAPADRVVPPSVDALVAGTLAHALTERTPTMTELRRQIAAALADEEALEPTVLYPLSPTLLAPVAAPSRGARTAANTIPALPAPPAPRPESPRARGALGGLLGALVALVVLGGWVASSEAPSEVAREIGPRIVSPAPATLFRIEPSPVIPDGKPPVAVVPASVERPEAGSRIGGKSAGARGASGSTRQPAVSTAPVAPPAEGEASHKLPPPPPPPVAALQRRAEFLTPRAIKQELDKLRPVISTRCFAGNGVASGTQLIGDVHIDSEGKTRVAFSRAALPGLASCIDYWIGAVRFPSTVRGGVLTYSFFAQS